MQIGDVAENTRLTLNLKLICQVQNQFSIKPNAQIRCSGCYEFGFIFQHNINQLNIKL